MDDHTRMLFLEVPVLDPCIPDIASAFQKFAEQAKAMPPEELAEAVRPKGPQVRELTEADIPGLLDIEQGSFPDDPYDADTFKHWLGQGGGFAVEDGGKPVAYALHRPVKSRPGYSYVQSIATHPDHRRKGYASLLLDRIKQLGDGVTLDVDVRNRGARALYRKHGFKYEDTLSDDDTGRVAHHMALKMAVDLGGEEEARAKLPYRDRAELYALKDGKVYGSVYGDSGAFGVYGGGIDPGENALEAAAREFAEEAGWKVKNPRLLPFKPHLVEWKLPYASEKQRERAKQFRGSRTHYVVADLDEQIPDAKLDELGRKDARLYDIDEALKLATPKTDDPVLAAANARRVEVLNHLKTLAAPPAPAPLPKAAFENYVPQLVLVKRAKDDDASPFTIAVDLDGTLAYKEEPFSPKSIGKPRPRAVYWLRLFHAAGARIIIFTVRGNTEMVKAWLEEHDLPYDFINENPDQPEDGSGKVIADAYWDDRAYNAEDPDEFGPAILQKLLAHGKKEDDEPDEKGPEDGPTHVSISISRTMIVAAPDILEALEIGPHEQGSEDEGSPDE